MTAAAGWGDTFSSKPKTRQLGTGQKPLEPVIHTSDGRVLQGHKELKGPSVHTNQARQHGWYNTATSHETCLPARVPGLQELLGAKGWPEMSIINVTGIGKSGKTTLCLQEAMLQAKARVPVLYIYNESPQARFMTIANSHRQELDLSMEDLVTMRFLDLHGQTLRDPKPQSIERFTNQFVLKEIGVELRKVKPKLVVIDSLSKLCRLWPAQAYYFAQCFTKGLWEMMEKDNIKPAVLCINQKSGGHWEEKDATVLGGYGVVHEMDGSIICSRTIIDNWSAERYGLPIGSSMRLIRIESLRDMDTDDDEHLLIKDHGALKIGASMEQLRMGALKSKTKKGKRAGG